jgi:exopolysaccharide biosynthesis polyprenyl glycosylphosphotransferase
MSLLDLYRRSYSRTAKRILDLAFALSGLLIFAPLLPLVALLVRRSGPGPVLYRQVRLGQGGNTFEILKFRTMTDGAEEPGKALWAEVCDERVTAVGRFLRRTRLDELPQLWNVLRGDMSIVGPRPERPEFRELLEAEIPFWMQRHIVKPGITGWAQVHHGYTSDVAGAAEKLSYDLYYVKHRSLALDLEIVAKTVRVVLSGNGAQ